MNKKYTGKVNIDSKTYDVEVRDGERYIDGVTVEEFMKRLTPDQMVRAARVGVMALKDERDGVKSPKGKYQYYMNEPIDKPVL